MEELKEKSLHPPKPPAVATAQRTQFSALDPDVQLAVRCAAEKKATECRARPASDREFAEYFSIASGANQRTGPGRLG